MDTRVGGGVCYIRAMSRRWGLIAAFGLLYVAIAVIARERYAADFATIAAGAVLGAALVALSVTDILTWRLPDVITLPLIVAGLIVAVALEAESVPMRALAAGFGIASLAALDWAYKRIRGHSGLGFGDAKLFGAAGAWVGFEGLASVLLLACASALLAVTVALLSGREMQGTTALPFGPFLCLGVWATWNLGPLV